MNSLMRSMAWLLAATLFTGAASTADGNGNKSRDLQPFEASYSLNYKGLNAAITTLTLTRMDGDRWMYRSSAEARGIFRALPIDNPAQSSEMRISAAGVQPLNFSQRNGTGNDRAIDLHFNWDNSRVQGMMEDKPVDETVPPDTQDDLSVQIALMSALARGQDSGTLHTFGDRGLREYRFRAEGEAMLHTAVGDVSTRIFVTERSGSPRVTRYWCATNYGYLPVRVQQQRLDELEWTLEIRTLRRG